MITRDPQMAPKDDLGLALLALAQASGMTPQHGAKLAHSVHQSYLANLTTQQALGEAADSVWAEVETMRARPQTEAEYEAMVVASEQTI